MKVIQIANTLSVRDGGPARNASELNIALNALTGTESTLYAVVGRYGDSVLASDTADATGSRGKIRRVTVWKQKDRGVSSIFSALRQIIAADIVIIHGYFLPWVLPVTILLRLFNIPYVLTPHGSLTLHQQQISRRKKMVYEAIAGRVVRNGLASFVTGSVIEAQELLERFPNCKVAVGGVGVRLPERFKQGETKNVPARLLSMSRLAEVKRIDITIRAVEILLDRGYNLRLTVAGIGPADVTQRLYTLGKSLLEKGYIEFVGQVTGGRKHQLFCESDIFVMPSDNENFGIGFAEAMAHGLPSVVSTKVASATKMPTDAGVLVDAPTPETMADAIAGVLTSENYQHGQQVARSFAEAEFSWSSVAEKWRDVLSLYIEKVESAPDEPALADTQGETQIPDRRAPRFSSSE